MKATENTPAPVMFCIAHTDVWGNPRVEFFATWQEAVEVGNKHGIRPIPCTTGKLWTEEKAEDWATARNEDAAAAVSAAFAEEDESCGHGMIPRSQCECCGNGG